MDNFILNNSNSESDLGILDFLKNIDRRSPIIFKTSGTTGDPKSISHSYDSIVRNIKISKDFKDSIWGLTYDYSKIAASQVILQSYLNGGKIVNLFDKKHGEVVELIENYGITHLSATPTFYRMLTNCVFRNVKQITLGGESADEIIIKHVNRVFPNAKVSNVYALTEFGTLFSSCDEYFSISESKAERIKIENNHILVRTEDGWIDTGDIVEIKEDGKFKIIGRESSIINVGGYKINPIKVESLINGLRYVKNSRVYGLDNSVVGKIVAADIVTNCSIEKKTITEDLKKTLNKYEMPLKINIVETIDINSTGKIIRN